VRSCDSRPRREGAPARAVLTQPATAVQETGVGSAAWDRARRLQQTPRPTRRAGTVQHYPTRCAPAAHMSSLSPGEGSSWNAVASPPWPPAFAPSPPCARLLSWPQHCWRPLAWRVTARDACNVPLSLFLLSCRAGKSPVRRRESAVWCSTRASTTGRHGQGPRPWYPLPDRQDLWLLDGMQDVSEKVDAWADCQ